MLLPLILPLLPIPPLLAALIYAAIAMVDQRKRTSTPFLAPAYVPSRESVHQRSYLPVGLWHVYRLTDMERGSPAPQKECVWR